MRGLVVGVEIVADVLEDALGRGFDGLHARTMSSEILGTLCFSFLAGDGVEPPRVHVSKGSAAAKVWLQPISTAYAHASPPPSCGGCELAFYHCRLLAGALE